MRIGIRRITMTEIYIDFENTHETELRFRSITPERLLSGRFTTRATVFIAILFLIGLLLVDIGTALTVLSKILAVGLSIFLLITACMWGIKWFDRLMNMLVEWWLHHWGYKDSQQKCLLESMQRHQRYPKDRILV